MLPVARVVAGAILAVLVASPALAQTRVRVTVDRTPIWRQSFLTVVTVVLEGTELEVVSRQGDWLEVVVPGGTPGDRRTTGFVSIHQVSVVSGTLPESGQPAPAAPVAALPGQRPPPAASCRRTPASAGLEMPVTTGSQPTTASRPFSTSPTAPSSAAAWSFARQAAGSRRARSDGSERPASGRSCWTTKCFRSAFRRP